MVSDKELNLGAAALIFSYALDTQPHFLAIRRQSLKKTDLVCTQNLLLRPANYFPKQRSNFESASKRFYWPSKYQRAMVCNFAVISLYCGLCLFTTDSCL